VPRSGRPLPAKPPWSPGPRMRLVSATAGMDYSLLPTNDEDLGDDTDAPKPEAQVVPLESMREERLQLDEQEQNILRQIEDFNLVWESRRAPLDEELEGVRSKMVQLDADIIFAEQALAEPEMPQPPGPQYLAWVEGTVFPAVSNMIVALNLASMIFSMQLEHLKIADAVDNVFLVWYIFELGAKTAYHQRNLYFGKIHVVWWNWLDFSIVAGGILDQWVMTLVVAVCGSGPGAATSLLGAIKFLRFLRVLRILKFVRALMEGDARWTESPPFEIFMSGVIALNAIVMSLELDIEWSGWVIVENAFMLIYTFELIMKLKLQGCNFLVNIESLIWNYLDIILVVGGALDLWLFPAIRLVQETIGDPDQDGKLKSGGLSRLMSLLRLLRIMRVLRLVRLLKTIKPLYRLLLGVIESLRAMQWVMVLTLLMLYAGAIFWTSLVGKGLLYGGDPPADGVKHFGTVATSLFSLFRIMNGDTSVVRSVCNTVFGQLLFAVFMVLSNWAILAILTSVVSDNMISASQSAAEEDNKKDKEDEYNRRVGRLNVLFKEIDKDGSGCISAQEWHELCQDPGLFHELSTATSYNAKDLHDLFRCLAASKTRLDQSGSEMHNNSDMNMMVFEDFLDHLKITADPADKRCVLQVMAKLQHMEIKMERQIQDLWDAFTSSRPPVQAAVVQPSPRLPTVTEEAAVAPATPEVASEVITRERERTPPLTPSSAREPRQSKPPLSASPSSTPRPPKKSKPPSPAGSARGKQNGGLRPQDAITKL